MDLIESKAELHTTAPEEGNQRTKKYLERPTNCQQNPSVITDLGNTQHMTIIEMEDEATNLIACLHSEMMADTTSHNTLTLSHKTEIMTPKCDLTKMTTVDSQFPQTPDLYDCAQAQSDPASEDKTRPGPDPQPLTASLEKKDEPNSLSQNDEPWMDSESAENLNKVASATICEAAHHIRMTKNVEEDWNTPSDINIQLVEEDQPSDIEIQTLTPEPMTNLDKVVTATKISKICLSFRHIIIFQALFSPTFPAFLPKFDDFIFLTFFYHTGKAQARLCFIDHSLLTKPKLTRFLWDPGGPHRP